uniref:AsIV-cont00164-ORF1 n=1 Tax=Apophua simplicipes ichnovirus TaxID=1329648 RepID=S5DT58_9VIRU|nr:AsIV-cont00164-ORF1 [Apophua simplicipes ichnovirus]
MASTSDLCVFIGESKIDNMYMYAGRPWSLEPYHNSAVFMNGFNINEKFIVTTVPKSNQINEFFQMIFQQNVRVIVIPSPKMPEEDFGAYWKRDISWSMNFDYAVSKDSSVNESSYYRVKLYIQSKKSICKVRVVTLFEYTEWLPSGVPASIDNFWTMIMEINVFNRDAIKEEEEETLSPIIVHDHFIGGAGFNPVRSCIRYSKL